MTLYKVRVYYRDGSALTHWFPSVERARFFIQQVEAEYDDNIRRVEGGAVAERISPVGRPIRNEDVADWLNAREPRMDLLQAAQQVIDSWSGGDLAGAVNQLEAAIEASKEGV